MKKIAVLLVCAAAFVAAPSDADALVRVTGKNCGTITGTQNNLRFQIYAKGVGCSTAFAVVSRTVNGRRDVRGWRCAQVVLTNGDTATRCARRGTTKRVFAVPLEGGD